MRDQIAEQSFDTLQKFSGLRKRTDVAADLRIFSSEVAEARHKMRIGQEAHVEDKVGVARHAEAVSETHNGNEHGALVGILETLGDKVAQLMHVELRCINDYVG